MSGVITTGNFPKLKWPGIKNVWGMSYEMYNKGAEWKDIYAVEKSDKAYEEDVSLVGFGLAPKKSEGSAIVFDTSKQGVVTKYINLTYALGFIITREEVEDNLYPKVAADRTKGLAFSCAQTKEIVGANVLNRAFNTSYPVTGDGVSLCNTAHPIEGDAVSNTLSVGADLSEAALEAAAIEIAGFVDNRGNRIAMMPRKLILPRQLQFEATRILKNAKNQPNTAERNINALYINDTFPDGMYVNHYLVDPNAWFILTNCPNGMKCYQRTAAEFDRDKDFSTTNLLYSVRERYSFGASDWRGIFGSPG